jgi:phosphoglycerol transferase
MGKKKRNRSGNPAVGSAQTATDVRPAAPVAQSSYSVAGSTKASTDFYRTAWFEWLTVAVVSTLSYWFLTARLVSVNVSVLIDEYSYVLDSHYRALTEAYYPNYLFQLVYSITKQCGPEFYSCARSLNAVFVIAGAIFLYLLAKYVSGKKWLGSVAAIAAILGSYGTYTAYFMPEAIFNFPMIVFFWALIRFGKTENLLGWGSFGVILGIASLAKPHAFFVIPALVIFMFFWTRATKERFLVHSILRISSFLAGAVGAKFLLGYSIAGTKALSIFGSYGDVAGAGNAAIEAASRNSGLNVVGTAWGQTLMIVMILGFALPVAIAGILSGLTRDAKVFEANKVRFVIGLSLLNMMAVSALFEAWLSLFTWMHTRYYSYLIPLTILVLIEGYSRSGVQIKPLIQRLVVGIFLVLASVSLVTAAIPYGANWIDAPDFRFHIDNIVISSILIIVSIALVVWWLWDRKTPLLVAVVVSLVASTLSGAHISNFLVANFGQDSAHDQLGRVLRNYLPQIELDKTILVGDNNTTMERALFGSLSGEAKAILAPEEGFDVSDVPVGSRWLVKVGEPLVLGVGNPDITGNGYYFYSLSTENQKLPKVSDAVSGSGLCVDDAVKLWSCGGVSDVSLKTSVVPNATIDLILELSEEAAAAEVEFTLGDSTLVGTLPVGVSALTIDFANSTSTQTLTIKSKNQSFDEGSKEVATFRVISVVSVPRN